MAWEPMPSRFEVYGPRLVPRFLHPEQSPLRECQQEALQSLVQWFQDDPTKDSTAVVVMPTGSGKSDVICCLPFHIGGAIAKGMLSRDVVNISQPVLVIAPGIDILNQLEKDLPTYFVRRGFLSEREAGEIYSVHVVKRTADVNELDKNRSDNIILSNSQKWRHQDGIPIYRSLPDDLFSMVIVDEAHHLPAKQWQEIIKKFSDHAKVVFFTATPYRSDGQEITKDRAISNFGYAYELRREDAIDRGWIRDVTFTALQGPLQPLPPNQQVLARVIERLEEKNRVSPLPGEHKHAALIIAKSIDEAEDIKAICINTLLFPKRKVALLHSEKFKGGKKRSDVTDRIKEGRYSIVIVVNMLREGFDYPPFSIAGIVTGIRSQAKFEQFVGRIQRVVRHGGSRERRGIHGDIITHRYFNQRGLYDRYRAPLIVKEEDKLIDED